MTATLHFLWGLPPKCLCTPTKPSPLPQNPSCFSQLITNFYSCLSPLLPAYPCVLGVARQQQLCGALLSFPNTYYYLCCQSPTTTTSAQFTLGSQKSEFLPGSLSPSAQPKTKEHAQGPGEFPHSQVRACTLSLTQIQTGARTWYVSTLPLNTLVFMNGKPGKMRGCGGATWSY